jgi:hypothetical protein
MEIGRADVRSNFLRDLSGRSRAARGARWRVNHATRKAAGFPEPSLPRLLPWSTSNAENARLGVLIAASETGQMRFQMRKLLVTTALAFALSLPTFASVHAQDSSGSKSNGNAGSGGSGGASGSAGAGGTSGTDSGDKDTGGTTGLMTTTPRAKSDDAVGTRAPGGPAETAPSPASSTEHGCTSMQVWDATSMACVPK